MAMSSNSKEDVEIREFRKSDLSEVIEIERECFMNPWPRGLFTRIGGRNPEGFKVAVYDSRIIGYGLGRLEGKEGFIFGHLLDLAVDEEFRRFGVGSKLLTTIEDYFQVRDAIGAWLEVRYRNKSARKFYLSHDYVKVDYVDGYYPNGDDALIMGKMFEEADKDIGSLNFE